MLSLLIAAGLAMGSPQAGGAPVPIAPPVIQQTADCARPTYATDQLVCADPELRALDQSLAGLVGQMPAQADIPWLESQDAWLRRRSLCAFKTDHRGCAQDAYQTRIAELEVIAHPRRGETPLRCPSLPTAARYAVTDRDMLMLLDEAGAPLVLAWPKAQSGWAPNATYRRQGRKLVISRQDGGAALTCR